MTDELNKPHDLECYGEAIAQDDTSKPKETKATAERKKTVALLIVLVLLFAAAIAAVVIAKRWG